MTTSKFRVVVFKLKPEFYPRAIMRSTRFGLP